MAANCDIRITQIDFGGHSMGMALARHRVREFPLHTHDACSAAVILAGRHIYRQRRTVHRTRAGHVIFTNPQEPHGNEAGGPEGWHCLRRFDRVVTTNRLRVWLYISCQRRSLPTRSRPQSKSSSARFTSRISLPTRFDSAGS